MVMDRSKLDTILTCFQASARGYLVRKEVLRAREDFENIVEEIDGGLSHVEWKDTVIPIPRFTDTDEPFLRFSSSASKAPNAGLDVCVSPHRPEEEGADDRVLQERIEAERDDPHGKAQASLSGHHCPSSSSDGEDGEGQRGDGGSTSVWSSVELDMNCSHSNKGPRQYGSAQEVPCTPEALRLHRNTLTMELVWLQQAIDSRKKYLSLKDRLNIS